MQKTVGIVLFPDVEILDFAGPYEVFAVAGRDHPERPFRVVTIAHNKEIVVARHNLKVMPDFAFADAPEVDILIVPGGFGSRAAMRDPIMLDFVRQRGGQASILMSVCTGSLILGRAGLLDGKQATTHHDVYGLFEEELPSVTLVRDTRFVDEGAVLTSGGISAGIDLAFHVVSRLLGIETAKKTAEYMEYRWQP